MVELVMMPASAPPSMPPSAGRMSPSENNRPSQPEHMAEMKRVDSKLIAQPAIESEQLQTRDREDLETNGHSDDEPSERLCVRRGKNVDGLALPHPASSINTGRRRPSASASAAVSAPTAQRHHTADLGMLSVGLSRELADELGMLPATVFTPATR